MLHQYESKHPEYPTVIDLINYWDCLKVKSSLFDLAGCFIPLEGHVNAGLNGKRFILRPCLHPPIHVRLEPSRQLSSASTRAGESSSEVSSQLSSQASSSSSSQSSQSNQ